MMENGRELQASTLALLHTNLWLNQLPLNQVFWFGGCDAAASVCASFLFL